LAFSPNPIWIEESVVLYQSESDAFSARGEYALQALGKNVNILIEPFLPFLPFLGGVIPDARFLNGFRLMFALASRAVMN